MALTAIKLETLLKHKGISAIVRVYLDATFDPATNKTTLGDVTEYSVKIIPPYKREEKYGKETLIVSGKGMTGLANKDLLFTVKAGLILVINSKEWITTNVVPLSNNIGVLFYLLEIES